MNCLCSQFGDLDPNGKSFTTRIKASKKLKEKLKLIEQQPESHHRLSNCPECGQLWQSACSWTFGRKEYLFKVPVVEVDAWLVEPYWDPDEVLTYSDRLLRFIEQGQFKASTQACLIPNCPRYSATIGGFCLSHHIENLQRGGLLPKIPAGRQFGP